MKVPVSLLLIFGLWRASVFILAQNSSDPSSSIPRKLQTDVWEPKYPVGDPRRCMEMDTKRGHEISFLTFEVFPGFGWDNLRNVDQGQVVYFNYSQCQTTSDGRYLLPDFISVLPVKISLVQTSAEIIMQWTSYISSTSASINLDMGLGFQSASISGKFSTEYQYVKTKQMEDDSYTAHTMLRYPRYQAILQPYAPLHPTFKKRLLDIAAAYQINEKMTGRYLCELLVRDYGTHVSTKVEAGATLEKLDQIDKKYVDDQTNTKVVVAAAASASFYETFSMNVKVDVSQSDSQKYMNSITSSKVITRGGPVFMPANFSLNDWASNLDSNLVAIDRTGDPLHFFVTATNLPELPASTLNEVLQGVKDAVEAYYSHNAIPGCTERNSENFSPQANVNDGSCKPPLFTLKFGGVYKTCKMTRSENGNLCYGEDQKNIMTQSYNCPIGFTAVPLNHGEKKSSRAEHVCESHWIFWKKCHDNYYYSVAEIEVYWCVSTIPQTTGVLFGGIFTSQMDNPLTNSKRCSSKFMAARIGIELDLYVCVMKSDLADAEFKVPFAGFYSCRAGNPLSDSSHLCPEGYSGHIAAVDDNCEIDYCMVTKSLPSTPLTPLKRPPFLPTPPVPAPSKDNLVVFDPVTNIWKRDQEAMISMATGTLPELMGLSANEAKVVADITGLDKKSLSWNFAASAARVKSSGLDTTSSFSCDDTRRHQP